MPRAGELLAKVERAKPGPKADQVRDGIRATLARNSIPETTGRRWQKMAAGPAPLPPRCATTRPPRTSRLGAHGRP